MPRSSETLLRLTTLFRVKAEIGRSSLGASDLKRLDSIIDLFSREAAALMNAGLYKEERAERFNIRPGQRKFIVSAWPIDTDEDIDLVNNADEPRVWTQSADAVDADYVLCNPDQAERGEVEVLTGLIEGPDTLQITYTGGLASFAGAEGADGVVAAGSLTTFSSASSRFLTDGVAANYKLVIESGANRGTHTISAVPSETALTVPTLSAATEQPFHILDSNSKSLVTDWPEIAEAMTLAVADYWRMRGGRTTVASESAQGMSVTYQAPFTMPYFARDIFKGLRKRWAF